MFGRSGKRARLVVPWTAAHTRRASGTSSARRPIPLRARMLRPTEIVPSGKTPMQAPPRSASMALTSAPASPAARSIGIWPSLQNPAQPRLVPEASASRERESGGASARPRRPRVDRSGSRGWRLEASGRLAALPRVPSTSSRPQKTHDRDADGHRDPVGERERLGGRRLGGHPGVHGTRARIAPQARSGMWRSRWVAIVSRTQRCVSGIGHPCSGRGASSGRPGGGRRSPS